MMDFIHMILNSWPVTLLGIALIIWSFYTLIAHPDRVLIDAMTHKRKVEYTESKEKAADDKKAREAEELMAQLSAEQSEIKEAANTTASDK
ncbi:hypothetical protein [Aminicella lysinilytica]|uniref:hypothetical protein n=1 Tax=Aminicella lysinilytica TaxID=433323 RepID=UPI0026EAF095|nr:hypothetical protein [Aminicella lysinilytica]